MTEKTKTVQDALNTFLASVSGVTVAPGVLTLSVEAKQLPAGIGYLKSYQPSDVETQLVHIVATYAVDVHFAPEPASYLTLMPTVVPAVAYALYRQSTIGGEEVTDVTDLGQPNVLYRQSGDPASILKQFEVVVEWDETL